MATTIGLVVFWILGVLHSKELLVAGLSPKQGEELVAGNWDSCTNLSVPVPPTRIDTTARVSALRTLFTAEGIAAYIIPNEDAHQSEYPSAYDKRRGYISGFQGSAGYAVVTRDKQALWTDGRYFLEAEDTLDCNWILMRQGEKGVPSMTGWLNEVLSTGDFLGASSFLIGSASWKAYEEALNGTGRGIKKVSTELIDQIWTNGRPSEPSTPMKVLPMAFAGVSWEQKINDTRAAMTEKGVGILVITSLDETAWLFNLRASDIAYNPFFISYALLTMDKVWLYVLDHTTKLAGTSMDNGANVTMSDHLNTGATGSCSGRTGQCVQVHVYDPDTVVDTLGALTLSLTGDNKVWLSYSCNYAIYSTVPKDKIYQANTPVATTKTNKNPVEVQGMKNSHIRDAAALISFLSMLEKDVKAGSRAHTEVSAAQQLKEVRMGQEHNEGLSFNSISAVGSNGAIIHYSPSNLTDKTITTNEMYLLDSGGQYLDGTTDVTRTFHFGTPTDYEKECYTRVLMGHIDLFQAKWPKGLYGREIDAFARKPLWDVGLVYRHGTGHGIGMFLSVHEGPGRISLSHSDFARDNILDENQFFSDEPGYYQKDMFGIRLENIVRVTNATTQYQFPGTQFLTFDHVTLVPYEPNLINLNLLNTQQLKYLNDYNKLCREHVGPELQRQGNTTGYDWLMARTNPYELNKSISGAQPLGVHHLPKAVAVLLVLSLFI